MRNSRNLPIKLLGSNNAEIPKTTRKTNRKNKVQKEVRKNDMITYSYNNFITFHIKITNYTDSK